MHSLCLHVNCACTIGTCLNPWPTVCCRTTACQNLHSYQFANKQATTTRSMSFCVWSSSITALFSKVCQSRVLYGKRNRISMKKAKPNKCTVQSLERESWVYATRSKGLEIPCQNTFKDKPAFINRLIKVFAARNSFLVHSSSCKNNRLVWKPLRAN